MSEERESIASAYSKADDSAKYEDRDLSGSLWPEPDAEILRTGSININGQTKFACIARSKTEAGDERYELLVSAGLLFVNRAEEKKRHNSPDISGKISIDGVRYKFGGWAYETPSGRTYTSVGLDPRPAEPPTTQQVSKPKRPETDEGF